MFKPKSPCLGCEKRSGGCHSVCEKYAAFRHELDEYKEKVIESRRSNAKPQYNHTRLKRMYEPKR